MSLCEKLPVAARLWLLILVEEWSPDMRSVESSTLDMRSLWRLLDRSRSWGKQWQQSVEYHWSDVAAAGCCCVYICIYMKKERLYQMPVCNDSRCIRAHTPSPLPANAAMHYSLRRIRAFCLLEPDCTLQVRLGDDNKNCLEFSRPLVSFEAKDDRVERWERSISTLWK